MEYLEARDLCKEFCAKSHHGAEMQVYLGATAYLTIWITSEGGIFSIQEEYKFFGDTKPTVGVHDESYLEELLDEMQDRECVPLIDSDGWWVHLLDTDGKHKKEFLFADSCRQYIKDWHKEEVENG